MPPEDGDKPATRSQLDAVRSQLDAKIDGVAARLDAKIDGVAAQLVRTQGRMDRMENTLMTELRGFRGELLAAFETSVVKGRMYEDKALVHGHMLQEHEARLVEHDRRLKAVEGRP